MNKSGKTFVSARDARTAIAVLLICSPAFAQLERGKTMLETIATWLLSLGIVSATIAIMWVGYRMMFQAAQWKDVAPIFWGALLIGGSSGIATMLMG